MSVELLNHSRQRHKTALLVDPLTQLVPLSFESLLRYAHVEVAVSVSFQIAIIAKRVSRKVELHSLLLEVYYRLFSRLISCPIQCSSFDSIHPLRLPPETNCKLFIPHNRFAPAGLPGSSADLSTRAVPFHPEEPDDCSARCYTAGSSLHHSLADWPLLLSVTRPKTGSLALRLACSPCKASAAELLPLTLARLLVKRAIYKISSFQNIRSARLVLALQKTQKRIWIQGASFETRPSKSSETVVSSRPSW